MGLVAYIILMIIGLQFVIRSVMQRGLLTRRAIRMKRRIGENPTRVLYAFAGVIFIIIAIVLYW